MADDTFSYQADSLMRCGYDLRIVGASVREGTVDGLEDGVDFGNDELTRIAGDFCARWNQGLKLLIGGNEWLGDTLTQAVARYVSSDEQAAAVFAGLDGQLRRAGL